MGENILNKKRLNLYALIIPLFLITVFFCVAVNSKNSFLYSFNDSFDVHCFVTTAKAMLRGDILYRDIYEQKGPMLYFIYMIGLKITDSSFLGVYLIESLFFSVFILFVFKTAKLYIDKDLPCTVIAIITAVISSSTKCFLAGGQCEELSLPFLAVTLYLVLRYFKKDYPNRISAFHIIIIGICFSVLFWMKYVMVGLFIGLVLAIIILQIKNKKSGYIFLYAFEFLIGFAIGSLPVIIYFYRHNAFGELWECYFYNLIFKYGGGSSNKSSLLKVFSSSAFYRRYFGVSFAVSAAAAYILFSSEKHMKNPEKLASILMMIFEAMGIGMSIEWDYSAECMFAFAVLGFVGIYLLITDCKTDIYSLIKKLASFVHKAVSADISKNTVVLTAAILLILMSKNIIGSILQTAAIYFLLKFLSSVSNKNSETRKRTLTIKYTLLAVICLISLILRIFILSKILIVTIICTALEDLYATDFKAISKLRGKYSKKRITSFCGFGFAVVMIISAFSMSTSSYDIGTDISTFPQYQISEHIKNSGREKPSIILYDMLDPGIYWLTGNEPPNKFFCSYNNENLEEVKAVYSEYIDSGKADFIISISPVKVSGYKEVYHDSHNYRYAGNIRDFYLYEKMNYSL